MKKTISTIAIISVLGILYIKNKKKDALKRNEIVSAWVEGVISGADITFYDDKSMKYCSMSLFGEKCYSGKYELINDTFIVRYSKQLPRIKSTKMITANNKLLFLNDANEIDYEFYLDDQYRDDIN